MNGFDRSGAERFELNRRTLLRTAGIGLGAAALGSLEAERVVARAETTDDPLGFVGLPHFPATAKRVIYLFMSGGPSQIDLFDGKESIRKLHGTPLPPSVRGEQRMRLGPPRTLRRCARGLQRGDVRRSGAVRSAVRSSVRSAAT